MDKTATERHFIRHPRQAIPRSDLRQTRDFKQNHAGLYDGRPKFRFTLTFTHTSLGGDRRHGFMREHANKKPTFAADEVGSRDAARFDRFRA